MMPHVADVRRSSTATRCSAALAALLGVLAALALPAAAMARQAVTERAVSFTVRNANGSRVPCAPDGAAYTVRGHLAGPRAALQRSDVSAATVYLHGLDVHEWFWRFEAVPGYDYVREMAKAGFVSVTIDKLGYGDSGRPDGNSSCVGAQADVAHQVITMLRHGGYSVQGGQPIRFGKIALAGHSNGGAMVQAEAYSFRDIDALLVMSWADQGFTTATQQSFARAGIVCAAGGEPAGPGGPGGYAYFGQTDADFRAEFFHSATPGVVAAATKLRNRNPCGDMSSIPPTVVVDNASLSEVTVPVLLISGQDDAVFSADGVRQQRDHYSGSSDVTLALLADTAHAVTLERTAPTFRVTVAQWLARHGFREKSGPHRRGTGVGGCPVARNVVFGSSRNDRLRGTNGRDSLVARSGNDQLSALRGNDCLTGERGADRLDGGPGRDRLLGGSGSDRINAGSGRDLIRAGSGNDRIYVRDGRRDVVHCDAGRDAVVADRADVLHACERVSRELREQRGDD